MGSLEEPPRARGPIGEQESSTLDGCQSGSREYSQGTSYATFGATDAGLWINGFGGSGAGGDAMTLAGSA
jgi:hypothetical protein